MIPLTIGGTNRIGLSYTSFGFTLIGGMTTATLLTLLIVPVFYSLFDDARAAVGRALTSSALLSRSTPQHPPGEEGGRQALV
jgi:HAE1 family hydrophobic/amphiphilic exporter-1